MILCGHLLNVIPPLISVPLVLITGRFESASHMCLVVQPEIEAKFIHNIWGSHMHFFFSFLGLHTHMRMLMHAHTCTHTHFPAAVVTSISILQIFKPARVQTCRGCSDPTTLEPILRLKAVRRGNFPCAVPFPVASIRLLPPVPTFFQPLFGAFK